LAGFEDATALFLLFGLTLGGLRLLTNNLANVEVDLPALPAQISTILVALLTGYLTAGFLLCMLQTLPWNEKFMSFEARVEKDEPPRRKLMPPDRVWLALRHRAGAGPFAWGDDTAFDPDGTFELRYARLRRYKEQEGTGGQGR